MTGPRSSLATVVVAQPPPSPLAWTAGALLFVPGLGGLVADYATSALAKQSPHTSHLLIFAGIMVVGVLVPLGRYVFPVLLNLNVIVGDYIPGGRRRGDPPAPPGPG